MAQGLCRPPPDHAAVIDRTYPPDSKSPLRPESLDVDEITIFSFVRNETILVALNWTLDMIMGHRERSDGTTAGTQTAEG